MAETGFPRKIGPRNKPLGSGMSKRRLGKRRVTFFAPGFQLGVAWDPPPGPAAATARPDTHRAAVLRIRPFMAAGTLG